MSPSTRRPCAGPSQRTLSTFHVPLKSFLVALDNDRKPSGDVRKKLIKGQLSPPAFVPPEIELPPYAKTKQNPPFSDDYEIHDEEVCL
eukprot:5118086-Pyramimonas_sp.AAC.2